MTDDTAIDRAMDYTDLLIRGVEVVVWKDPDVHQWIAGSQKPYQVQQGRSPLEALTAWKRCCLLQVLMDLAHRSDPVEMEPEVWKEMTTRSGAKTHRATFTIDGYW